MTEAAIAKNIAKLADRIGMAAQKYGRSEDDILLLAVSKTRPAQAIREAFACGVDNFGENYLQEALDKITALGDLPLHWHFIGPIQSNKTRTIAQHFNWVHSVDRLKIARRLSEQRPSGLPPLAVCLQVNVSAEDSKSGVTLDAVDSLAAQVNTLPGLQLRGLMAIPQATEDEAKQRENFALLHAKLATLRPHFPQMDTLSMGMSADLDAAIAEGTTILRIGTAVFGPRER